MIFSSLDFSPELQKGIDAAGYEQMTPIQEQAIIPARRGKDLLAIAQTGTGKTAAFSLPILQLMLDKPRQNEQVVGPRTLILTPTRELAEQLAETISNYAQFLPFTILAVYGGVKLSSQASKLKAGVDVLIGTPGRMLEHISECNVDLAQVEFAVLDEADRMLDMGFQTDAQALLNLTAKKRQTLLFSATSSDAVSRFAKKLLNNHQEIMASQRNMAADTIEHVIYPVEERRKIELFLELLDENNWYQVLVFTSTKEQADKLKAHLRRFPAAICHADKSQGTRRRAIADFKSGKVQILIATEVAARGLDIQGLEHVVNFNLPYLAEDYVHRIGRAGRAGGKGYAISFVSREEERSLENIQKLIKQKIKRVKRPGYEVTRRDELIDKVKTYSRPARQNKVTETKISKTQDGKTKRKSRSTWY
uniref:ATP-dependent RNA helicase VVA0939 n=1 Tax=uncultured Thiotrichaceae bacterium TaxID=298394 RepID=A0A6S6UDE6_9GAMM|nr:MAG: ATP-dependent RNA helicase VVA0939 [uncultured Thiotrichaceae bacterium]